MIKLFVYAFFSLTIVMTMACSTPDVDNTDDNIENTIITMDNSSLNSDFAFLTFTNDKPSNWAGYGNVNFDGKGNGTYNILSSTSHIENSSFTYLVNKDGTIKFTFDGLDDSGMLGIDKNIFTVVDTNNFEKQLKITIGIKKSSGMYNSDIIGDYVYTSYYNHYKPTNWCSYGTMTFDGNGGGKFQDSATSEFDLRTGDIFYNVETNGIFSYRLKSINYGYTKEKREGIISDDKNVIITVNTNLADRLIGFEIAIKKSSGMDNSSLDGEYIVVSYANLNSKAITCYGRINFDGKGKATYSDIKISDETLRSYTVNYSVEPDGEFILTSLEGEIIRGMISPDKNTLSIVNTDIGDRYIAVHVALKKNL